VAKRLARVLAQCAALAYLDLSYNHIGAVGGRRLRASWRGQASGLLLEEDETEDEDETASSADEDEDEEE
jgi:hypothetical protein